MSLMGHSFTSFDPNQNNGSHLEDMPYPLHKEENSMKTYHTEGKVDMHEPQENLEERRQAYPHHIVRHRATV